MQLSIEAGHDVAVYITTDPVGGGYDTEAVVFAGGEDAHGVPTDPHVLTWTPNGTTPDIVYYQVGDTLALGCSGSRRSSDHRDLFIRVPRS